MLALIQGNEIVSLCGAGGWFTMPDGTSASPAMDGWSNDDYRLATIAAADPIPNGKYATSTVPQMVNGAPKYVHTLADIVPEVPALISDRQFFQALAQAPYQIITQGEALAAVKTGEIPAAMQAMVAALPQEAQFGATMLISGATIFNRDHPLTLTFGAAFGWSSEQIDAFFTAAAAL